MRSGIIRPRRNLVELGLIDYLLMGFGSALACWSAGMSLFNPAISLFCLAVISLGQLASYVVRVRAAKTRWIHFDVVLYCLAGVATVFLTPRLQQLMPDGGFPADLSTAGWLCWMIMLGSFFCWRDSTLLFQAVPTIALFGLVGVYDTFHLAVVCFFGFLVCLTTLFARSHSRQMLRSAVDSGFFELGMAPGSTESAVSSGQEMMDKLDAGPWRWVAGPGWALASALVVVFLSFLGAPVIQFSLQGVAGFVRVNPPRPTNSILAAMQSGMMGSGSVARVSQGPNHLTNRVIFKVKFDHPRLLRGAVYDTFTGHEWAKTKLGAVHDDPLAQSLNEISPANSREFRWEIDPQEPVRTIPLPGFPVAIRPNGSVRDDGTIEFGNLITDHYEGTSIEANPDADYQSAVKDPSPTYGSVLAIADVPADVYRLTKQVTAGAQSDREMAARIMAAIDQRVKYSIDAPACPSDQNATEFVLFQSHVAYCDMFATSMVQMARVAGIPARYVSGFAVTSERSLADGDYVVEERDAHAWAELLFKDVGWVAYDATSGAESVDGDDSENGNSKPFWQSDAFREGLDVAILFVAVIGVWFGFLGRSRAQKHPNYSAELDRTYRSFERSIRSVTRARRRPGQTIREFVLASAPALGSAESLAREIAESYDQAFFGEVPPNSEELGKLKTMNERLRKAIAEMKRGVRTE